MQKLILILFTLFIIQMKAQVLNGKIIDSNTKLPLESASVFVENSSIATMSKKDGTFQIDLRGLKNNVVIDYVGYVTYLIPKEDLNTPNLTIYLKPSDENLAEMIIDASPFSRKEMMKCFKKYFLGTTANGKSCKILNEKAIVFYFDRKTNTLFAESSEPLIIENKNLDYKIRFVLEEFQANFNARSLEFFNYKGSSFFGYSSYTDVSSNEKSVKHKRKKTYENGIPFFLKALATDELQANNIVFYLGPLPTDEKEFFKSEENDEGYTIQVLKMPMKKVPDASKLPKKDGRFVIVAGQEGPTKEVPTNLNVLQSKTKNQSIVQLNSEQIQIDKNGNLLYPSQVFFGGFFGDLKLGDMLPVDYEYIK